jgi:hypothetical protein
LLRRRRYVRAPFEERLATSRSLGSLEDFDVPWRAVLGDHLALFSGVLTFGTEAIRRYDGGDGVGGVGYAALRADAGADAVQRGTPVAAGIIDLARELAHLRNFANASRI